MFKNIAYFFIKNSKLTAVLVFLSFLIGIGSYYLLPKQFNPSIVVPAFQIQIPSPGLDSSQINQKVISKIENSIFELKGIDEVYSYSYDNFAGIMAKFDVGIDSEDAKIRLIQKIDENFSDLPSEVGEPKIFSIDPEELSQITYSINYVGNDDLSNEQKQIYLRQIARLLEQKVKTLQNVTTIEIVGGYSQNIIIDLDLDFLNYRGIDILQVYDILQKYNFNSPVGNIVNSGEKIFIGVEGKIQNIEELKKIIISNFEGNNIYLEDLADVRYGVGRIDSFTNFSDNDKNTSSVLIGFGKKIGTNSVNLTNQIQDTVNDFEKEIPNDVELEIIQNEGQTAQNATNMLLVNLFQSFLIVFVVLAFYLGIKNAFNTAISIPLTLLLVFFIALIIGDNINKITLFALILVLGMIVDNSTVVVENISRHLDERIHTGKNRLDAVLSGVQEVGFGVIMATVTRLLAFGSMFFVTGMMGEYMGPIPKYAIFALLISLLISLTINPWISYFSAKDITENDRIQKPKNSKYDIRKYYLFLMKKFLGEEKKQTKNRKIFKIVFWLTLVSVIFAPIYLNIFKARMLPKSDQNQIYVWIDGPRSYSAEKMQEIENYMSDFFFENDELPEDLNISKNLTSTIGNAFVGDFANLFRGGSQRSGENQISSRLNLIPKEELNSRVTSEYFTINIRDIFKNYMLEKYPDLKIRLQEDPPGPPVIATFLINLKSSSTESDLNDFMLRVQNQVESIKNKYSIVDLYNSNDSTYRKLNLKINNQFASDAGITTKQIASTLGIIFGETNIGNYENADSFENNSIILTTKNSQNESLDSLNNIFLTSKNGQKIALNELVEINYHFVSNQISTKDREEIKTIFAEMGDDSLVYPVVKLFNIFLSEEFLGDDYEVISWNPYGIKYLGLNDGKEYHLEWGGEWELTIDTFRDLGIAMILSLLTIYFLLVGQFSSFKIAGIIMITFLLSFFGVFPGFTGLYLLNNEYFSATSMIGIIALGGIVVGNAIILIDYLNILKKNGLTIGDALLKSGYVRFAPIILTSLTTVFGAATIIGDPVWSGLAWTVIWGLLLSSILTLIVIPIFYYDSQKNYWK